MYIQCYSQLLPLIKIRIKTRNERQYLQNDQMNITLVRFVLSIRVSRSSSSFFSSSLIPVLWPSYENLRDLDESYFRVTVIVEFFF